MFQTQYSLWCGTIIVGSIDAGVDQTLVGQTGSGDGNHWGGQRLAGRTADRSVVTLKKQYQGKKKLL